MKTRSNSDKISLGRGYGTEILNSVKKAEKSVKIVSPYLSASYLDELINLRKKGVEITLITSDNLTEQDSKYSFDNSKVIKQEKMINQEAKQKKKSLRTTSVILFLIFLSTLALSYFFIPLLFLSILFLIISLIMFIYSYFIRQQNYKYYSLFRLKVFDSKSGEKPLSTSLIHSKIFMIDEKICFLGSANFTWSGFKTHYETIIKVEDIKAINDINQEIENLFVSKELAAKDIQKWGKEIYE